MDLQHALGSGALVQLVDVLRDHHQRAALTAEARLALGDGSVCGAGLGVQSQLSPVVVELPHPAGVTPETAGRGQILCSTDTETVFNTGEMRSGHMSGDFFWCFYPHLVTLVVFRVKNYCSTNFF